MSIYLNLAGFKDLTTIPASFVDEVEAREPGWVDKQLAHWGRWIDARLRKRYASPFAAHDAADPTPVVVQGWLSRIVTPKVWLKRGVDPSDLEFELVNADATAAQAEVLEAAKSDEGWFDLPLRTDEDASAIARGGPLSYSEQSPYVWADAQSLTGREEDAAGGGSFG